MKKQPTAAIAMKANDPMFQAHKSIEPPATS